MPDSKTHGHGLHTRLHRDVHASDKEDDDAPCDRGNEQPFFIRPASFIFLPAGTGRVGFVAKADLGIGMTSF
jgi:hypothetical protein